jgi:hypothetical protein
VLSRQAPLLRRPARTAAGALTAVAVALVAGGCGGDSTESPSGASTSLTVTLDVDGTGKQEAQQAQVSCPGDDACASVEGVTAADLAPVKPTQACTEIFGGPEVATVEGTLDGEDVQATLNRSNGCEIDRFGTILPLLQALFPDYVPGQALQP